MKALLSHHGHHSEIHWKWQKATFVLACAFLLVFAGSLFAGNTVFTHVSGKPTPKGFANVPGKPSPQMLSHIAFKPDLAVERISFEAHGTKGKNMARIIVRVKNVGKATSSRTTATALLTRGDGTKDKKSFSVKALKVNSSTEITWSVHTTAGKNTVKVTLRDPNNRANNTLEKIFFVMARAARTLAHHEAQKTNGARRALAREKAKHRGRLSVQEITFDDHKKKKPN